MNSPLEHITPATAERLAAHAAREGLSVEAYLQALLGIAGPPSPLAELSDAAFDALLEAFATGGEHVPPLPPDFSRRDIYLQGD
jgi:hypothetical protein